jgi:hypothetical protein
MVIAMMEVAGGEIRRSPEPEAGTVAR